MTGVYRYGQEIGPFDPEPDVDVMVQVGGDQFLTRIDDGFWYDTWSTMRYTWAEIRAFKARWIGPRTQRSLPRPLGWKSEGVPRTLIDVISTGELPPPPSPKYATYIPTRSTKSKFTTHAQLSHAKSAVRAGVQRVWDGRHGRDMWPDAVIYEWDGAQWQVLYLSHPHLGHAPWEIVAAS